MKPKKNPEANLGTYSTTFMQLGLTLALFISYLTLEYKVADSGLDNSNYFVLNTEVEEIIPQTFHKEIKHKAAPKEIVKKIDIIDDASDAIEDFIKPENIEEPVLNPQNIVEVDDPADEINDIPFPLLEEIPIYPGCEGVPKSLQKKCFTQHITQLVNKSFDSDLAATLGLSAGKKRIFVIFKIDKSGNVTDVRARAPHKRLEREAIRVVNLIPRMIPGKKHGRTVGVKYSLPIVFNVQD